MVAINYQYIIVAIFVSVPLWYKVSNRYRVVHPTNIYWPIYFLQFTGPIAHFMALCAIN